MKKMIIFVIRYMYSFLCVAYIHSIGILFRHGRKKIRALNKEFGFTFFDRNEDPPNCIPEIPLREICSINHPILCLQPEFESGGVSSYELICINVIVAHFSPHRVFEIGTFNGRTTLNIAANVPVDTKIYTLDLPLCATPRTQLRLHPWDGRFVEKRGNGRYFLESIYRKRIIQLYGDSAIFDFTPYNGTIDIVFVDASHSYEYVKNDSEKALSLLRGGKGIILWHDYGTKWHDVTRALNDLYAHNPEFKTMKHIRATSMVFQRFE
jgi:hypothetical protein